MKNTEQSFAAGHDLSGTVDGSPMRHILLAWLSEILQYQIRNVRQMKMQKKPWTIIHRTPWTNLQGRSGGDHGIEINPSVEARKDPVDKDANNTVTLNRQNENEVEAENKQEHTKRIAPGDSIDKHASEIKTGPVTEASR